MAALQEQVAAEHGPNARIIAAEKVTVGGIRGFFARQHFEVTVEIRATDAVAGDTRRGRRAHAQLDAQARLGIAALLEDAEEAEARVNGQVAGRDDPAAAGVSTVSGDFAALMDDLTFNTTRALPHGDVPSVEQSPLAAPSSLSSPASSAALPLPRPPVPRPLGGAGDLIVIIGLHDDALTVAESMAAAGIGSSGIPGDVALAGALASGYDPAWDRRRAIGARARGVERGQSLFVAFGIGSGAGSGSSGRRAITGAGSRARAEAGGRAAPGPTGASAGPTGASAGSGAGDAARMRGLAAQASAVQAIGADQVWVAVDAGRKPDDTARWVQALAETLQIDAVAVVGSGATSSPETVQTLRLPVGWVDGDLPLPVTRRAAGASNAQARLV
jgi:hypothetical protein